MSLKCTRLFFFRILTLEAGFDLAIDLQVYHRDRTQQNIDEAGTNLVFDQAWPPESLQYFNLPDLVPFT